MSKELTTSAADVPVGKALPVVQPRADIYAGDERAVLVAELPGVPQDKIELIIERDRLTIRGDTEAVRFERSFVLAEIIDRDAVEARHRNGVLRVSLPHRKPDSRRIDVQAA